MLAVSVAWLAAGGMAAQGPSTHKKPATSKQSVGKRKPSTTAKASPASARPAATVAARRRTSKGVRTVATTHHYTQQQPTPDRYREIQQALADRGYFSGPLDGNWGAASVDALKRFQVEQNLPDDGKIGSLSLIALGLGPKRTLPVETATGDHQEQR